MIKTLAKIYSEEYYEKALLLREVFMTKKFDPSFQKLKQMQSLPLEQKIIVSKMRIRQWHEHYEGSVHVSFSGGGRQYGTITFSTTRISGGKRCIR